MSVAMHRNLAVLTKELRTRMRGRRAVLVITVYLLLLSTLGGAILFATHQEPGEFSQGDASGYGSALFVSLSVFQLLLVVFIVPGLTGAAIAGERDRQTLDLLLSTQVSSLWIVLGKILASLSYVLLLILTALPLLSVAFLFGGVSPRQVALAFAISMATALSLGTIGVFLSVLVRRGQIATVLAYAVTFLLLIGTPMVSAFIALLFADRLPSTSEEFYIFLPLVLNPLFILALALLGQDFFGGGQWVSVLGMSLWHVGLIVDAILSLVFLYLASRLLRVRRSRFRGFRRAQPAKVEQ